MMHTLSYRALLLSLLATACVTDVGGGADSSDAGTPSDCACERGQRCVNGACELADTLLLLVTDSTQGDRLEANRITGASLHQTNDFEDGPCVEFSGFHSWTPATLSAGDIAIVGKGQTIAGAPAADGSSYDFAAAIDLEPNEPIGISTTGGTDIPA